MSRILLLHGAIGAASQLAPLADQLRPYREVITLNFSGHGGQPFTSDNFRIDHFAAEVKEQLHATTNLPTAVFGYSMGGYVAMYIARHMPGIISRIITLGTKYNWTPEIAEQETSHLHPTTITQKVPAFAATLRERHHPQDWQEVLHRTADMMMHLGHTPALTAPDFNAIDIPCLLLVGDKDKMVSPEETIGTWRQLPLAQLGILPATPHPIEQVAVEPLAAMINRFLD